MYSALVLWYHFRTFQRPVVSFGDNTMFYSSDILDNGHIQELLWQLIRKTRQTKKCSKILGADLLKVKV